MCCVFGLIRSIFRYFEPKYVQCILYIYTNSTKMKNKNWAPNAYDGRTKKQKKEHQKNILPKNKNAVNIFRSHLNGIRQIFDYCAGVLNTQNSCILVCESTVVFYLQLYIHCLSIYCLHLLFYSLKNSYIATKKAWIKSKWRKKNIYRK